MSALLEWQLMPDAPPVGASVYRSVDGLGDWELISDPEALNTSGYLVDRSIKANDMTQLLSYRIDLEHLAGDGSSVLSSTMVHPDPRVLVGSAERAHVRRMIMSEIMRLRRGPGIPCFIYAPIIKPASMNSPVVNIPCPQDDTTFGYYFGHGFSPPFQTWVQLMQQTNHRSLEPDGTGSRESVSLAARLPGYPYVRSYYLLVIPGVDRRFVLGDKQTPGLYRGVHPITFDVQLHELVRSDPRYRVPVPPLDPKLASPRFT